MASSVLKLNLQKCSTFNTRSVLSVINNKHFNGITVLLGKRTNNSTNLCHTRSLCYLTPNTSITKQITFHQKLCYADVRHGLLPLNRKYSTNEENQEIKRLPTTMEFPKIVWPSLLKTIKNWILVNLIVRPYFDQEFNMPTFVNGTKHALQVRL